MSFSVIKLFKSFEIISYQKYSIILANNSYIANVNRVETTTMTQKEVTSVSCGKIMIVIINKKCVCQFYKDLITPYGPDLVQ